MLLVVVCFTGCFMFILFVVVVNADSVNGTAVAAAALLLLAAVICFHKFISLFNMLSEFISAM